MLVNLTKIVCNSAGTGPFVLGANAVGFFGIEQLTDGATYPYSVQQADGSKEYGRGVFNAVAGTLSRNVIQSSSGTDPIAVMVGSKIAIVALAEDLGGDSAPQAEAWAILAGHFANDNTDVPVPDQSDPTARGAKFWASAARADRVATDTDAAQTADDRIASTNAANIASTAVLTLGKIQFNPATPTTPPPGVVSGEVYYAVDANPATKLTSYVNNSGTGVPTDTPVVVSLYPSVQALIAFLTTTATVVTGRQGDATVGSDTLTTGGGLTVFGPRLTANQTIIGAARNSPTIGNGQHKLVVRRLLSGADYETAEVRDLSPVVGAGRSEYTCDPIDALAGDYVGFAMPAGGPSMGYTAGTPPTLNAFIVADQSTVGDHGSVTATGLVSIEAVFGTVTDTLEVGYDALSPELQAMIGGDATSFRAPAPIALPSGSIPIPTARMGLSVGGQSNAASAQAYPPISTTQIFSNVMTTGGVRTPGPLNGGSVVTTTAPLVENTTAGADGTTTSGETICSGVNYATQLRLTNKGGAASDVSWHPTDAGWSGQVIENLRKGQGCYGVVTDQLQQVYAAASIAALALSFPAHAFIQGESNAIATNPGESNTRAAYLAQILAYFAEVRGDMKAKSGQAWNPHTGMLQIPYATLTGVHPGDIQLAQFDAVNNDPLCHFVMPLYFLSVVNPGADDTHYPNVSQHVMQLYWGRWLYQLVHEQRVPDCVWPLSVTAKGKTVSIKFRTPTPLRLDTVKMFAATDYGFKITDGAGTLTLSNIQIIGGDTVQITINRALSGLWKARYALDYAGAGQTGIGYACGNLRDSTPETWTYSSTTYQLFHAAPHFEMAGVKIDATIS